MGNISATKRKPPRRAAGQKIMAMAYEIDYTALHARLLTADKHLELINYIFRVQGADSRHLDYRRAADALHVDRKTVRNYVNELTDKGVLVKHFNCKNWEIKLSDDLLKETV